MFSQVSVYERGICPGVSVRGGVCPGGLCLGGVSVGGVCDRDPPYGKEWAVSIPLECILVLILFLQASRFSDKISGFSMFLKVNLQVF